MDSCGHGQQFEDNDQEQSTSLFGHGTLCKSSLRPSHSMFNEYETITIIEKSKLSY